MWGDEVITKKELQFKVLINYLTLLCKGYQGFTTVRLSSLYVDFKGCLSVVFSSTNALTSVFQAIVNLVFQGFKEFLINKGTSSTSIKVNLNIRTSG